MSDQLKSSFLVGYQFLKSAWGPPSLPTQAPEVEELCKRINSLIANIKRTDVPCPSSKSLIAAFEEYGNNLEGLVVRTPLSTEIVYQLHIHFDMCMAEFNENLGLINRSLKGCRDLEVLKFYERHIKPQVNGVNLECFLNSLETLLTSNDTIYELCSRWAEDILFHGGGKVVNSNELENFLFFLRIAHDLGQDSQRARFVYLREEWGRYLGEVEEGTKQGLGVQLYCDHFKFSRGPLSECVKAYAGNWRDNLPEGEGFLIYEDGRRLVANFSQGQINHIEMVKLPDDTVYRGDLTGACLRHGQGILFDRNNTQIYEGTWENDHKVSGFGREVLYSGVVYEGNYTMGARSAEGRYQWGDGTAFIGRRENGARVGKGECWWADGWYYNGEWLHDMRHGKGVYMHTNRSVIKGTWENDAISFEEVPAAVEIQLDCADSAIDQSTDEKPSLELPQPTAEGGSCSVF